MALDVHCECDSFESKGYGKVPYLDVSASYNPESDHLTINVVNRHSSDPITAKIENHFGRLIEAGMVFEITGEDVKVTNDFSEKENVKTVKKPISVPGNEFSYEFPPHSITTLKLAVR